MNIEFTDRYSGHPPSWLRFCRGQCEGMGWYPERIATTGIVDDDYGFVKCPICHGTGRCSWTQTMLRIPQWIGRGIGWCWSCGPSSTMWSGHPASYLRRAWLTFKIAFLCDLGCKI